MEQLKSELDKLLKALDKLERNAEKINKMENKILKLKIDNRTKHLEKYIKPQWTWKTYLFLISLNL